MAVAAEQEDDRATTGPTTRSKSKKRAAEMDAMVEGGALKKPEGAAATNKSSSAFSSFPKKLFACFHRPITVDGDEFGSGGRGDDDDGAMDGVEEFRAAVNDVIILSDEDDVQGGSDQCGVCHKSRAEDAFTTSCGHQFCRSCINEHVSNAVKGLENPTLKESLTTRSRCPKSSCSEELSWKNLVELLGDKRVRSYGKWYLSNYGKYFAPLSTTAQSMRCWNVNCDQRKSNATLSVTQKDLHIPEGGFKEEGSKVFWSCAICGTAWCAFCGTDMPAPRSKNERNRIHPQCKGQWKFMVYKCMVDLDEACTIFTQGRQLPSDRKTTSKSSNLTIWASGTGFGGDNVENKKSTESMLLAAKKKELELDNKVAVAFHYLSTALDRGGSGIVLPADIYMLFSSENILKNVLCQLATNDSMLDISERRNLYSNMVALLKAIKLHKELEPILLESSFHEDQEVRDANSSVFPHRSNKSNGVKASEDKDNTLVKKMQNIYKQAKVMVQRFQANEATDAAAQMDINLAIGICECYESLHEANANSSPGSLSLEDDMVSTNTLLGDNSKLKQQAAAIY